jgi:hypothetical protein
VCADGVSPVGGAGLFGSADGVSPVGGAGLFGSADCVSPVGGAVSVRSYGTEVNGRECAVLTAGSIMQLVY